MALTYGRSRAGGPPPGWGPGNGSSFQVTTGSASGSTGESVFPCKTRRRVHAMIKAASDPATDMMNPARADPHESTSQPALAEPKAKPAARPEFVHVRPSVRLAGGTSRWVSEKIAMSYYLDGRVSCVFGTHTHVATADEKVLPMGSAYITDIGMTGAHDSVLGRGHENVLKSFRTQMPCPFEVATGDVKISAILVVVDSVTKKADRIERLSIGAEYADSVGYDGDDGRPEYTQNGF